MARRRCLFPCLMGMLFPSVLINEGPFRCATPAATARSFPEDLSVNLPAAEHRCDPRLASRSPLQPDWFRP